MLLLYVRELRYPSLLPISSHIRAPRIAASAAANTSYREKDRGHLECGVDGASCIQWGGNSRVGYDISAALVTAGAHLCRAILCDGHFA